MLSGNIAGCAIIGDFVDGKVQYPYIVREIGGKKTYHIADGIQEPFDHKNKQHGEESDPAKQIASAAYEVAKQSRSLHRKEQVLLVMAPRLNDKPNVCIVSGNQGIVYLWEGEMKDGLPHGEGVYTVLEGDYKGHEFFGTFKYGSFTGEVVSISCDGKGHVLGVDRFIVFSNQYNVPLTDKVPAEIMKRANAQRTTAIANIGVLNRMYVSMMHTRYSPLPFLSRAPKQIVSTFKPLVGLSLIATGMFVFTKCVWRFKQLAKRPSKSDFISTKLTPAINTEISILSTAVTTSHECMKHAEERHEQWARMEMFLYRKFVNDNFGIDITTISLEKKTEELNESQHVPIQIPTNTTPISAVRTRQWNQFELLKYLTNANRNKLFKIWKSFGDLAASLLINEKNSADRGAAMKVDILDEKYLVEKEVSHSMRIGSGHFGDVFKVKYKFKTKENAEEVALKVFRNLKRNDFHSIKHECEVGQHIGLHDHVVATHGLLEVSQLGHCLMMELVDGPSLEILLYNDKNVLDLNQRGKWLLQVAKGMRHLHSFRTRVVLHGDLKSSNVLLTKTNIAKISDFGVSRAVDALSHETYPKGAREWAAPETFHSKFSKKSDVYSFAIVIFETFSRTYPFSHLGKDEKITALENQKKFAKFQVDRNIIEFMPEDKQKEKWLSLRTETFSQRRPQLSSIEDEALEWIPFMTECWSDEPDERPDFEEIINKLEVMQPQQQRIVSDTLQDKVESPETPWSWSPISEVFFREQPSDGEDMTFLEIADRHSALHQEIQEILQFSGGNRRFTNRATNYIAIRSKKQLDAFSWWVTKQKINYKPQNGLPISNVAHRMFLNWDRESPRLNAAVTFLQSTYPSRVPGSSSESPPYQSLIVYHGMFEEIDHAKHICKCGFRDLGLRNDGWYGKGVYFTPDLDYALAYGKSRRRQSSDNAKVLVIACEMVIFNSYPVGDENIMRGRPIPGEADVNVAVVQHSDDLRTPTVPVPPSKWKTDANPNGVRVSTEIVMSKGEVLPRFILVFS
eukprot:m.42711 g.42711  ORF g.42711 m.42711 type:complete len:1022 (+) comp9903_c1_seq2:189-3254(+)